MTFHLSSVEGDDAREPRTRRHIVHVYAVIRIKVAVEAVDHRGAMAAADAVVFGESHAVQLRAVAPAVIDADFAGEVTEYLVDEDGDCSFSRSCSYGPDYTPSLISNDRRAA